MVKAAARSDRSVTPAATAAIVGGKGRIRLSNEADILRAAEHVFARAGFGGATMAAIAERAGVPKSNLHYYFKSKQAIYRAVLSNTLELWLMQTDSIRADSEPRAALGDYIRAKMQLANAYPEASRVFANEMLNGAPEIGEYLRKDLRELVERKSRVIKGWIAQGKMADIDPRHLFFTIWAATQTYADFEPQVCAVLGVKEMSGKQTRQAGEQLTEILLRGCGISA
ncbi:TetR/AcrR family transcriptional regulator [soil metagenome]